MLIIGSRALNSYVDIGRSPADIDIIATYDEAVEFVSHMSGELHNAYPVAAGKKYLFVKGGVIVEAEIAWEGSLAEEFLSLVQEEPGDFPSLNALYTLKMSHRYLRNSSHFVKTINDIKLMRAAGATIPDELRDWFKRREAATYDYSHPNLNVNKKQFFAGDGIDYVYDHDSIHAAVKIGERPAYTYFKPADNEVMVSRTMWNQLDYQTQLNSVLEESYVLAIERSQVPFPDVYSPHKSFLIALQKVCTSITSGWWREFAWENYNMALAQYDGTYIDRFWTGVESGIVRLID